MRRGVLTGTALAVVLGLSLACLGSPGAADKRQWGNPEGGVDVSGEAGAIAVAAGGSFIAWRHEGEDGPWLVIG